MIRFEDLMAARLLYQRTPDRRDVLLAGLEALQIAAGPQRSLLSGLVASEVLTMDQARYVFGEVERWKRSRGVGIYAHLLSRDTVPAPHLQKVIEQIGPDGDLNALGDRVRGMGLIDPSREHQLRFQARLALDRDMRMQVELHMASHGHTQLTQSDSGSGPLPLRATLTSQVIKGDLVRELQAAANMIPAEAEVREIVRGTLSDADEELPGPRFRIPDCVDMSDRRTGKTIGSYRILGRIGAGNMGVVYLADNQDEPERPVALKLLPRDAGDDARGRFKREILANSFFSHEGALDVYDAGETEAGHHYLAMEFFDGDDLEKVLDECHRLPPRKALQLSRQVFETLAASHSAGVVHRDVKPANMLVSRDYEHVKLMDFGIAIIRDLNEFKQQVFTTLEGGVTGTPEYMSPEQASGEPLGKASDLYSMGVVLYQLLSGRLPFESETSGGYMTCHMIEDPLPLAKADPSLRALPRELHELLASLLEKNPMKRPPDAGAVVKVIDFALPRVKDRGSSRLLGFLGWRKN